MDELERSLRREVEGMQPHVDEGLDSTLAKVGIRRRRRRVAAGVVGLALPALLVGIGWLGLRPSGEERPAGVPSPSPSAGPSPTAAAGPCAWSEAGEPVPDGYEPGRPELEGDVDGDGSPDRVRVLTDETRPERCRWVLRVETGAGDELVDLIAALDWPGTAPALLMLAEIDGRPGVEIVVDLAPANVYRPGGVFAVLGDNLIRMERRGPSDTLPLQDQASDTFPLQDEFPAGVDCTGDPGTIVITFGGFADGDDRQWRLRRTRYRVEGWLFLRLETAGHVVDVGTETERWPELGGDPFRSCPQIVD